MPPLKGFYTQTGFQFYNLEAQTGPVKYGFQNTKNQTKTVTIKNTGVIEKRISQFRFPTQPLSVLKIRKTKWFRLSFLKWFDQRVYQMLLYHTLLSHNT